MDIKIYIILSLLLPNTLVNARSSVDIPCTLQMDSHAFSQSQSPARIKDIAIEKGELDKDRALECQLSDKDGNISGRVLLEIAIAHDPPTELRLHVAYTFMKILESKRLICSYKDIGAEFHMGNVMPEKIEVTGKNGTYKCSENDLEVVLTGLLKDPSKIRSHTRRDAPEHEMCVRTSLRPPLLDNEARKEGAYCEMKNGNGTIGVLIFNEKGEYVCSRCCAQTAHRNGRCHDCPDCTKQEISIWSSCDPVPCDSTSDDVDVPLPTPPTAVTSTETTSTTTPTKAATPAIPQYAPVNVVMANRTTTSVYLTWNVLTQEQSTHYVICVEGTSTTKRYTASGKGIYIESLTPDTEYNITVAVANFNDTGPKSKVLKIKTLFQVPDVKKFSSSLDDDVARLFWLPQDKYNLTLMVTLMPESKESKILTCNVSDSDGKVNVPLHIHGSYFATVHYFDHTNNRNGTELAFKVERHKHQVESTPLFWIVGSYFVFALVVIAGVLVCCECLVKSGYHWLKAHKL